MYIKLHRGEVERICDRFNDACIKRSDELNEMDDDTVDDWMMIKNDINFFDTLHDMATHTKYTQYPYVLISANEFNRMRDYL